MPVRIQRLFDCQRQLEALQVRVMELGRRLLEQPGDKGLRQSYRHASREALDLSCRLVRLACEP